MKTLSKNQENVNATVAFETVVRMQQVLATHCLKQNLRLRSTVGQDPMGDKPYLQYEIMFNTNEPVVFTGQAYSPFDDHYKMMLQLVNGQMVSELFPPTVRFVTQDTDPISEIAISYWKRRLVIEHDITMRADDPNAKKDDDLSKVGRQLIWVGYSSNGVELIRITDGAANPNTETVDRVQYMTLGPRGMCVVVIFKDTVAAGPGPVGSLAEGLKGLSAGAEQAVASTSTGVSLSAPVSVSLSGTAGTSSASAGGTTPISNIDLSAMAVTKKPRTPALDAAIKRLAKGPKAEKQEVVKPAAVKKEKPAAKKAAVKAAPAPVKKPAVKRSKKPQTND